MDLIIGICLLIFLSIISFKFKFLDSTGIISAFIIGFIVVFFGGLNWFIVLLIFFLVSSVFTKYKYNFKKALGFAEYGSGARSWCNVIGNGGVAALFAFAEGVFGGGIFSAAFLGAVSTAFSDTMATEIGLLYPDKPRLITNFKKVEPGVSGAISPYGELATLFSSLLIGIVASILNVAVEFTFHKVILIAVVSGFIGSTIDSILGATIQAGYWCNKCNLYSEDPIHTLCGCKTKFIKGFRCINNHIVNFISTAFGGLCGLILSLVLP